MAPHAHRVASAIAEEWGVLDPPQGIAQAISSMVLRRGWAVSAEEAEEYAERASSQVLGRLRAVHEELHSRGELPRFDFNSSTSSMIQGWSFVEPSDSGAVRDRKQKAALTDEYREALQDVRPEQFERICGGILRDLGVDQATVTARSRDDGIDFYGRLSTSKLVPPDHGAELGAIGKSYTWLVGQAKRYRSGTASTFEIRELVGSVELGRAGSWIGGASSGLRIRLCDPVLYLFFTTGRISRDSWALMEMTGVVGMTGSMLASYLATRGIAAVNGRFSPEAFNEWVESCPDILDAV